MPPHAGSGLKDGALVMDLQLPPAVFDEHTSKRSSFELFGALLRPFEASKGPSKAQNWGSGPMRDSSVSTDCTICMPVTKSL